MTFVIPDSLKNPTCDTASAGDVSGFTVDVTSVVYPLQVTSIKQDGSAKGDEKSVNDIYGLVEWLNEATGERWDAAGTTIDKQTVFIHSAKTYTDLTTDQNLKVIASIV